MLNINHLPLFFSFYHRYSQRSHLNSLPSLPRTSSLTPLQTDWTGVSTADPPHSAEASPLGPVEKSLDSPQKPKSLTSTAPASFRHSPNPQTLLSPELSSLYLFLLPRDYWTQHLPLSLLCSPPATFNWLPNTTHSLKSSLSPVPSFPPPIASLHFQP